LISSDKRNPTVNANGPLYGATELSTAEMPVLDPVHNIKSTLDMPTADPKNTPSSATANRVLAASPYFGTEQVWNSQVNAHSVTMDQDGRVWWTATTRAPTNAPAFCAKGGGNPSADYFPQDQKQVGPANEPPYNAPFVQNARQVTMYDPKTKKFSFVDTCFNTQHLNFAEDANNTLWLGGNTNGIRAVVGWVNTKMFLETGDAGKSQGWTPLIVDRVGDGKPHAWTEPGQPSEPDKDVRLGLGYYAVAYSPADGSIWGSNLTYPGYIIRLAPGSEPPRTALTEVYKVPPPGFGIRGADVDRNGVVWVPLDSGHLGSFDRRKCKGPLNGPGAEQGNLCPEGWTFYPLPGPSFQGTSGAAESPYYTWVDQHDVLGLGDDVPLITGNQSDSIDALVGGRMIQLTVPYPMGLFAKWIDGRIDDPNVGWKGRGLWVTSGNRTPAHIEGIDAPAPGAPGTTLASLSSPLVFQFQMRPDPLAH
ncbi:MAG TPA: carboxypeptidase regulatory-like domain-containing protein, partial [Beijerinckiaceae bacterium]|nr:carboxypeptidase regulatory-like domain-containing protein [Beijerinckiaceae bacterium]